MPKAIFSLTKRQQRHYAALATTAERALTNLSPQTANHIRATWDESNAAPGDLAADLYAHLFAIAPDAVSLFPGDLTQQRQRLTRTLTESLILLDEPQELLLLLRASGVRHVHYHADFGHFPLLGMALARSFEQRLTTHFTEERREAWRFFYDNMAAVMCGAMATALMERPRFGL